MHFSIKHNRTRQDACDLLQKAVDQASSNFSTMIQRIEWSADRSSVKLFGPGAQVDLWVDDFEVHATADIPALSRLLGGPLVSGLRGVLENTFQKRLPPK